MDTLWRAVCSGYVLGALTLPNVGRYCRIDDTGSDGGRRTGRASISDYMANVGRIGLLSDHVADGQFRSARDIAAAKGT